MIRATDAGVFLLVAVGLAGCAARNLGDHISVTVRKLDVVDSESHYNPEGFFGYPWGTPFNAIPNLLYLEGSAALVFKRLEDIKEHQIQDLIPDSSVFGPCRGTPLVLADGSYIMVSYYKEIDWRNTYAEAAPAAAIYHFCASAIADSNFTSFRDELRLCGGDIAYQIDAPESWRKGDPPTNFDCNERISEDSSTHKKRLTN